MSRTSAAVMFSGSSARIRSSSGALERHRSQRRRAPPAAGVASQRDRRNGAPRHMRRGEGHTATVAALRRAVDEFIHDNESMLCSMDAITASTSARVSAVVRNVMPILTAAPDVVTATTIGDIGPVDAAAQVIAIAGLAVSAQRVDVERREPREDRMILEVQPLPPLGLCERPDQRGCAHRHQRHQVELEPLRAPRSARTAPAPAPRSTRRAATGARRGTSSGTGRRPRWPAAGSRRGR